MERSQPKEAECGEEHRAGKPGEPAGSKACPTTALAEFRAANPKVRALQDAQVAEFRVKFSELLGGEFALPRVLHAFVDKAELARQIGIVLIEFAETLAGKKLTLDFYEQAKELFTDAHGQCVPFEQLQWFMAVPRKYPEPITQMRQALECRQLLLVVSGEADFALQAESQRGPQTPHPEPDPMETLFTLFDGAPVCAAVEKLKSQAGYWVVSDDGRSDGQAAERRLRSDLVAAMRLELGPKLEQFDAARTFVKEQLGI